MPPSLNYERCTRVSVKTGRRMVHKELRREPRHNNLFQWPDLNVFLGRALNWILSKIIPHALVLVHSFTFRMLARLLYVTAAEYQKPDEMKLFLLQIKLWILLSQSDPSEQSVYIVWPVNSLPKDIDMGCVSGLSRFLLCIFNFIFFVSFCEYSALIDSFRVVN